MDKGNVFATPSVVICSKTYHDICKGIDNRIVEKFMKLCQSSDIEDNCLEKLKTLQTKVFKLTNKLKQLPDPYWLAVNLTVGDPCEEIIEVPKEYLQEAQNYQANFNSSLMKIYESQYKGYESTICGFELSLKELKKKVINLQNAMKIVPIQIVDLPKGNFPIQPLDVGIIPEEVKEADKNKSHVIPV